MYVKNGRKLWVPPAVGANGVPDPVKNPIEAYRYLDLKRDLIDAEAREKPLIRLWDNQMRYIGTVAAEKSVDAEEMLHDTGQGDIVLRGDDWLVEFMRSDVRKDEDLHVTIDPYPHRRSWRWRWGSKVTNVRVKRGEDGLRTVTLECAHNREHWKHLLFGATPFSAPEVQPLRAWLNIGNTRTIVSGTGFINLARNYNPLLALPTQLFNPGAWVGEASNVLNLNPLNWPVQMQFVNPVFDRSRLSVLMSRWQNAHDVCDALLKYAGCHVRAYTWLTEDEDSPHPELALLIGEKAARPSRNCIVLAVEDMSGTVGITGTAIDGALDLIAVSADNILSTLFPIDRNGDGEPDPFIRGLLGIAPPVPDIVFRDTDQSAIISAEHSMFRAKAQKVTTGGRSPGWLNQTQTFLIKYALSQLSAVIMAGPAGSYQQPGSSGMEEIYQGQADNVLLAYIQATDPVRAFRSGPYGYLEHFEQGSGSAYTVASAMTLAEGHHKTRAYQAFKVSVRNGGQHTLFYDFDLGTRCHFEIDRIYHTDQVSALKLHYDETTPKTYDLSIGDDTESESGLAQLARDAASFWNALGTLFGSGDMF
ncbi:minor tail protein [Mycobacterium phage Chris]|uniref:Minor tail protein n=1 Tax=Mycobacterium phage Chris TaxID=2725626 RepID=A0A6M3TAI1_9CAUD|nr:minor tail protein [Mycobacterium phage Chris]QJD50424.1 minor tail protein [Mycobacterium phage Chris]